MKCINREGEVKRDEDESGSGVDGTYQCGRPGDQIVTGPRSTSEGTRQTLQGGIYSIHQRKKRRAKERGERREERKEKREIQIRVPSSGNPLLSVQDPPQSWQHQHYHRSKHS